MGTPVTASDAFPFSPPEVKCRDSKDAAVAGISLHSLYSRLMVRSPDPEGSEEHVLCVSV